MITLYDSKIEGMLLTHQSDEIPNKRKENKNFETKNLNKIK